MPKIRVSIDLGDTEIEDLTLADLAELYEELSDFFDGDDEEDGYELPTQEEIAEAVKKFQAMPATYPWDVKPCPTDHWKHYANPIGMRVKFADFGPGWVPIGSDVAFNLDDAGIPIFGD